MDKKDKWADKILKEQSNSIWAKALLAKQGTLPSAADLSGNPLYYHLMTETADDIASMQQDKVLEEVVPLEAISIDEHIDISQDLPTDNVDASTLGFDIVTDATKSEATPSPKVTEELAAAQKESDQSPKAISEAQSDHTETAAMTSPIPDKVAHAERSPSKEDEELDSFVSWLQQLIPTESPTKDQAAEAQSISPKPAIISNEASANAPASEALAALLANQGYKKEAIEMYQELTLRNPEKSSIFADQIQKLRG